MLVAGTVPGSAWKLFVRYWLIGWLIPTGCLRHLGQPVFQSEMPLAWFASIFIPRQLPNHPLVLIAPLRRGPVAPVFLEHSSPLIWVDKTHRRTAVLKGKAVVLADLAAMGTMAFQHLAQCGRLYSTTLGRALRNGTVDHVTALHVDTPQASPDTLSA